MIIYQKPLLLDASSAVSRPVSITCGTAGDLAKEADTSMPFLSVIGTTKAKKASIPLALRFGKGSTALN